MRLWLSDKANRALKNLPPEDYVTCDEHGRQRYARAPRKHEEETGESWLCAECLKVLEEKEAQARAERRRAEEEEKEAKKAARKSAREATGEADEALSATLKDCKSANRAVKDTYHRLRERKRDLEFSDTRVAEAERALEEARRALEEARAERARAQEEVPALEEALEGERTVLNELVERLQGSLETADAAWKGVPPRHRKKRDRRTRHAAVQIINANRRWRERHEDGEGAAGEAEASQAPAEGEAAPAAPAEATASAAAEAAGASAEAQPEPSEARAVAEDAEERPEGESPLA